MRVQSPAIALTWHLTKAVLMRTHPMQSRAARRLRQYRPICAAALSFIAVSAHAQDVVDAIDADAPQPIAEGTQAREGSPGVDGIGRLIQVTQMKSANANDDAMAATQVAPSAPLDAPPATTLLRWFNRGDLGRTQWSFDDANNVGWAQAARAAAELCDIQGVGAGHFNGHQDLSKGTFGVQCSDAEVVWREASSQEISSSGWGFKDVNQVSWAQANRAAERLCASANQGFAGGHFNGHQGGGSYGLFCYRGAATWFDASDAELAATGWGFATPKLDDVQWAQAMRAATGFCQSKGFEGGFMNGHQAPNKYGVVCQPPVNVAHTTAGAAPAMPLERGQRGTVSWDDFKRSKSSLPDLSHGPDLDPSDLPVWGQGGGTPPANTSEVLQAHCNVAGLWRLTQSNSTEVTLLVEQRGQALSGTGRFRNTTGTITGWAGAPRRPEQTRHADTVAPRSSDHPWGRDVAFEVRWTDGHTGLYRGRIDGNGQLSGSAQDMTNPYSHASFIAFGTFIC